jgi:phage protein D
VSSFVSVEFPNSTQQLKRVYKANLSQDMFAHDYGVVYFRDWNVDPLNIKPGSLMTLTIKGKTFHGYVHDLENVQENNKHFTKVGFIGASFVMKQASQKIYRNMSADQIIAEIAKKYSFAYKVTPHPRIYTQVSQAGMSDWQFMVYLARQCGYFLRAENTEIYFQPITEDFIDLISQTISFQKADGGFKPIRPIYNFRPVVSETLANYGFKKSAVSVAGVNPIDKSQFKITNQSKLDPSRTYSNPELFDSHATTIVANDYTSAVHLANAANENSRFPYSADVETIGESSLRPGLPVYLNNVGTEYSGYWTILGVNHKVSEENMNHQMYTCEMTVASDSLGTITDNRIPTVPPVNPTRRIVPNQKNRNIKPKTVVYKPNNMVKKNGKIELITRINRAAQTGPFVATARWGSTHRNLNNNFVDERMPQAVLAKVRSNAAL